LHVFVKPFLLKGGVVISFGVVLVDDDVCLLKALELAIEKHARIELLGIASSCAEATELLKSVKPDVLVVDLDLPDGNGFDLIRDMRKENPMLECMVVTSHEKDDYIFRALKAGATGYKLKSAGPKRIAKGMIELWEGGSPVSPDVARTIVKHFHRHHHGEDIPLLGKKEKEVLDLMYRGFSRKELAEILNVSTNTIGTHVKRIYKKLGVASRSEAIYEATRLGLVAN